MTLNEEKKIMTQIKDLAKSRETVKEFNDKQVKISEEEAIRKAIIDRIRAKDLEINAVKAEQMQYRQALDKTRSKEDAAMADIPKLQEERNKCYETIKAKREEIRRLRVEFKGKEDEFWKREREFRAAQREEKQKRWEAAQEERKAREEARKKWELENAPEPFDAEVTAAEQLMSYLAKWDVKEEVKEEAKDDAGDKYKGLVLLNKKQMDDDEDPFALTEIKPKGKGKARKGKGANQLRDNTGPDPNERLNLSFDAYSHFSKLSLTAPNTIGEVPATIKLLHEKKALFLEKRKLKKERIAAGIDDEEEKKEKEAKEKAEKEAAEAEEAAKAEAEAAEIAEKEAEEAAEEAKDDAAEDEAKEEDEDDKEEATDDEEEKAEEEAAPADEQAEEEADDKADEEAEEKGKVSVSISADDSGESVNVEVTASEE